MDLSPLPWSRHELDDQQPNGEIRKERSGQNCRGKRLKAAWHSSDVRNTALMPWVWSWKAFSVEVSMSSQVSTCSETLPSWAPCWSSLAVVRLHVKKNDRFSSQESNEFSARVQEPNKTSEPLLSRQQRKRGRWWMPTSCPSISWHSVHPVQKPTHRLALLSGALTIQHPGPGCPPLWGPSSTEEGEGNLSTTNPGLQQASSICQFEGSDLQHWSAAHRGVTKVFLDA